MKKGLFGLAGQFQVMVSTLNKGILTVKQTGDDYNENCQLHVHVTLHSHNKHKTCA